MSELVKNINEAVNYIKEKGKFKPLIGIILGTGLGALVKEIRIEQCFKYQEIPHFPISTVPTHTGQLVFGNLVNKEIVAMQGRFHYYEGYTLSEVTFPVRVMKALGIKTLIISNAAGGLNPLFNLGDLMVIIDHINLFGDNPLRGPNPEKLGPRFPDMYNTYDQELIKLIEKVALEEKIKLQKGVYVGVAGPNLETAAEYRFLRIIGADAVGMSTVPEVIVAKHSGLKVLALSCITDLCLPDNLQPANINHIIKIATQAEPKLSRLVKKVVAQMPL
jgi:purine-nucleoside phosphorylase